jgi:hypothetical protein
LFADGRIDPSLSWQNMKSRGAPEKRRCFLPDNARQQLRVSHYLNIQSKMAA